MALTNEQKRRAKRKLFALSDEGERSEIVMREMEETQDKVERGLSSLESAIESSSTKKEMVSLIDSLSKDMSKLRSVYLQGIGAMSDSLKESHEAFLKGISDLHSTLKKQSFASEINANAGPLYKTMISHLAGMETAFRGWKYPQYAAVSVRNKNFANVNPAISPFGIEDYDEVDITYSGSNPTVVVYKLGGNTMGTLTLTYSGSNVTSVVKT